MRHRFVSPEIVLLEDLLCRPIRAISVHIAFHGKPTFVTLWSDSNSGVGVSCTMHDLPDRGELGVLVFAEVHELSSGDKFFKVDASFNRTVGVKKLVVEEDGVTAESGLLLSADDGKTIVIVAGAYPYTLAIMATECPFPFEPEYPIEAYALEGLSQ